MVEGGNVEERAPREARGRDPFSDQQSRDDVDQWKHEHIQTLGSTQNLAHLFSIDVALCVTFQKKLFVVSYNELGNLGESGVMWDSFFSSRISPNITAQFYFFLHFYIFPT